MTPGAVRFDLAWPWMLLLALVVPVLLALAVQQAQRRRRERLTRLAPEGSLARLEVRRTPVRGRAAVLGVVGLLAAIAVAGPRWGVSRAQETRRGIDVAIVIDASLSMMAEDERPNRLERVKQEVRRLRAASRADRVALIAFAGRSYILTPLTADDGALELYLENLDPTVVGQAGSSLARAIRQGTELLGASASGADRALVLMSDGEAFEPMADVEAAAAEAGQQGIQVVTVGFGTTAGATIPELAGNTVIAKRDQDGAVVTTRYEPAFLEAAATAASGVFVPADVSDRAGRVRAALATLRSERRVVDSRDDHVPRFAWLLAPALLLLLWDTWRVQRITRDPRVNSSTRGAPLPSAVAPRLTAASAAASFGTTRPLVVWFVLIPLAALACAREPDPAIRLAEGDVAGALRAYEAAVVAGDTTARMRYNLATALLAADSLQPATELLDAVRRGSDGEVRARARFNEGLAWLRTGLAAPPDSQEQPLDAARALYRSFLGERFADVDAKWNYELALRPKPPGGGGGGGGDDDQDGEAPEQPEESSGQLDQDQAEALLNSAAREERDVQGKRQRAARAPVPPGGKDW